jgi:hypothetical protein
MINESSSPELPGLTEPFLKDLAVRLSLAGYSLDESLQLLKSHQTAGLDLLTEQQEREARKLREEVEALEEKIQVAEHEVRNRQDLAGAQTGLALKAVELQERRTRLESQIRQKRRQRQASAIEQEAARRADRARAEVLERLSIQLEIGRKIFEVEEQCWKVNQPENERRKKLLEEELIRLDADLTECRKRVEKLKNSGITRTVSGFLIWAGYLGFAAAGSAISYMLADRFPRKGSDPWMALTGVTAFLRQLRADHGSLVALLAPIGFLLCLLAVFVGCIWLTDFLLRLFDRRWARGKMSRKSAKKESFESSSPLSPIAQILNVKMPMVERASFIQLLASVPYVFAAGAAFLLLSVAGASLSQQNSADPAAGLVPGYIGGVYALLATSVFILYILNVLQPRVDRLANKTATPTIRNLLAMHWELVVLLACLVLALAAVAFAPHGPIFTQACWGSLAIAMTLAGMGLAYGLIYSGQFRDLAWADRRRGEAKLEADSLSLGPTIELGGLYDADTLKERLDAAREEADDFELVRSLHATMLSYAEDPAQWSGFLSMWLDVIGGKSRQNKKKFSDELRQLAMAAAPAVDFEAAPAESEEVFQIDLDLLTNQAEVKRLEQAAGDTKAVEEALQRERNLLRDLLRSEREAQAALTAAKASLTLQQAREEMVFRAAFGVGEKVAFLLPPTPPSPGGGAGGEAFNSDQKPN